MDMAKRIVVDAKVDYPAACNAMVNYLLYTSILIISILMTLNSIAVNMGLHFLLLLFCYSQETLLVHKDLSQSEGLNDLIVDLRIEGWTFLANHFSFKCKTNFELFVSFLLLGGWGVFVSMLNFFL